jgi:hypothetical protein
VLSPNGFDKFELLASRGEYVVAILGNADCSDIELIDLDDADHVSQPDVKAALQTRGLQFIAAAGIVDGKPEIEMVNPLPEDTTYLIGICHNRHIRQICSKGKEPKTGDSLRFLEALWSLHDPRFEA